MQNTETCKSTKSWPPLEFLVPKTKHNPLHQIGTNADPNYDPKKLSVLEEFF